MDERILLWLGRLAIGLTVFLALAGVYFICTAAKAQQPSPTDRALMMSMELQRLGVAAQQIGSDAQTQLRAALNRIDELEKLCGEPCKPKPEGK